MSNVRDISARLAGLLAVLFVLFQGMAVAHELEHGKAPHSHDGIPCAVHVLGERDDTGIAPAAPALPAPAFVTTALPATSADAAPAPRALIPQPRGPPLGR